MKVIGTFTDARLGRCAVIQLNNGDQWIARRNADNTHWVTVRKTTPDDVTALDCKLSDPTQEDQLT